jgi:hypothetical protein
LNRPAAIALLMALALAAPAMARESLGVFNSWAAFRDPDTPRCYAIATPSGGRDGDAFMSVAFWPEARVRGQIHIRLTASVNAGRPLILAAGDRRFALMARGRDAWARDERADTAIIAALRGASHVGVAGTRASGGRLAMGWSLRGAATAIDAAALGCAGRG